MKIALAVSGTGGHIYPAISIAEFAMLKGDEIVFFCPNNSTTKNILKTRGKFNLVVLNFCGWQRQKFISLLKIFFLFFKAFYDSIFYFSKCKIDVVIGFGGYLAFPVCLAGKVLGKKVIIHEQNAYPGLSNKVLNRIVDITGLGFLEAGDKFKNIKNLYFTGNPVRKEFLDENIKYEGFEKNKYKQIILILGGSQGAKGLNKIIMNSLNQLLDFRFIHITGKQDKDFVKTTYAKFLDEKDYKVFDYYENIYEFFNVADLVVARSGASTVAEVLTIGLPAIFVPYPDATNDHQTQNAKIVKNQEIAEIFQERNMDVNCFVKTLKDMLNDTDLKNRAKKIGNEFKENNFCQKFYDILES